MEWEIWITWSYSVADIQDYFDYIIKKLEIVNGSTPIRIYVNKIENRIAFKIKAGYYLELSIIEMMKLLGSTKSKITNEKMVKKNSISLRKNGSSISPPQHC